MTKQVVMCSYMHPIDEGSVQLSVELHVDEARLTDQYSPMRVHPGNPSSTRRRPGNISDVR